LEIGGSEGSGAGVDDIEVGVGLGVDKSGTWTGVGDKRATLTRGEWEGDRLESEGGLMLLS